MSNDVTTNEVISGGTSKASTSGRIILTLGIDGNLQLKDTQTNKILWASGTSNKGVTSGYMGWDGNFKLQDANGNVIWATQTTGIKDAHLVIQDDGNLVVYGNRSTNPNDAIWASNTFNFKIGSKTGAGSKITHSSGALGGIGKFLSNAAKVAGKPFELAGEGLQTVGGAVSGVISKIPIVGKPFAAAFSFGFSAAFWPAMAVGQVVQGKRIDQAVIGQLKGQLADIKEVAPYAEAVISFIPGIGTGISAAIAGGLALASGQPITSAIEDGIAAAIPGGAIAKAAFDVAKAGVNLAISGKKVTWESLASAGIQSVSDLANLPPVAKNALVGALDTAGQLAKGVKADIAIGDGLADTAATALGKAGANAMKIGIALAHATFLQKSQTPEIQSTSVANKLMAEGQTAVASDAVASAAKNTVDKNALRGFYIGIGTMKTSIDLHQLVTLRASLDTINQQGFDHALSLHIGRVANPTPVAKGLTTPASQAGFFTTMGMQGAHPAVKVAVMTNIVNTSPVAKVGATVAVKQITLERGGVFAEFWDWLKHIL